MTAENEARRASGCATCEASGRAGDAACVDCDGAGWLDQDGEPCEPSVDALIAAAVMPIPALKDDPTWKMLERVRSAEAERDALRAQIAEAPHGNPCASRHFPRNQGLCTCWKAEKR